jgi:hypothetical protein
MAAAKQTEYCFCLFLFGFCSMDVKANNPDSVLTKNEMLAYLARIQEEPNNWLVHSTCLLLKSRAESNHHRTIDRAVLQIQSLVQQFNDVEPPVSQRIKFQFNLMYPPFFLMKKELGQLFLKFGAARSALEIFTEMDMVEEMVDCYRIMDSLKKAEALLRERLVQRVSSKPPLPLSSFLFFRCSDGSSTGQGLLSVDGAG